MNTDITDLLGAKSGGKELTFSNCPSSNCYDAIMRYYSGPRMKA